MSNDKPAILPGCSVLPPMELAQPIAQVESKSKANGKPRRGRASGRFAAFNAFIDYTMRELSGAETAVWMVLFRDTKPNGLARTSQADVARRAGLNVRTVKRAIAGLKRRELLKIIFRGGLQRGPSTCRVYAIPPAH